MSIIALAVLIISQRSQFGSLQGEYDQPQYF